MLHITIIISHFIQYYRPLVRLDFGSTVTTTLHIAVNVQAACLSKGQQAAPYTIQKVLDVQDGGDGTFASDSDRDIEISSSRSAPETSYSMDSGPSRPSMSHSPFAPAAPTASTSGTKQSQWSAFLRQLLLQLQSWVRSSDSTAFLCMSCCCSFNLWREAVKIPRQQHAVTVLVTCMASYPSQICITSHHLLRADVITQRCDACGVQ